MSYTPHKTFPWILMLILFSFAHTPVYAQEKITVLLDWFINPDHGPLIIAQESGIFAQNGLDVKMIEPADPSMPPKLVAAGQAEVAISYQPYLYIYADQGLPIIRFATLIATPLNSLVVLDNGKIKSLSDLKGKTVGFSIGGFEDVILGTMLRTAGMSLDDVTLINVNYALSVSLMSGNVDAIMGAYRNFELNELNLHNHKGRAFYPEEYGVPPYDELILITHTNLKNDPRLQKLTRSLEQAVQKIINYPQETWEIFSKAKPGLDSDLNRLAWKDTLPRFALRPGSNDTARYQRFGDYLLENKLIKNMKPVQEYSTEPQ